MNTYIESFCRIKNGRITLNGDLVYEFDFNEKNLYDFLLGGYKHFHVEYPKFHKMDNLSKLSFLGAELLFGKPNASQPFEEKTGIVLSNRSASLDTDYNFTDTIQAGNYFPKPGLFVYTLPNIMIGEIAIRHKIRGENMFLASEQFDPALLIKCTEPLFNEDIINTCLVGWVDVLEDSYELFMYKLRSDDPVETPIKMRLPHTEKQLYKLYKNK